MLHAKQNYIRHRVVLAVLCLIGIVFMGDPGQKTSSKGTSR